MNNKHIKTTKNKICAVCSRGTWSCIPSADHTTVHSESAMKFMSGFPSYIPQEATHFPFYSKATTHIILIIHAYLTTQGPQHAF